MFKTRDDLVIGYEKLKDTNHMPNNICGCTCCPLDDRPPPSAGTLMRSGWRM